jgi:hypothetical protein
VWEFDCYQLFSCCWDNSRNRTPIIYGVLIYHTDKNCSYFVLVELWYVCSGISVFPSNAEFVIHLWHKLKNIYMAIMYLKNGRVGIAVTLLARMRQVLGSSRGRGTSYPEFSQFLQANVGPVLDSRHGRFVASHFQFTFHLSSYHSTLQNLALTTSQNNLQKSK